MKIYGKQFASIYNENWNFSANKVWPLLYKTVRSKIKKPATWLDLCCGTGLLLDKVSTKGIQATGVDFSKYQLQHARRNAPQAHFICKDIRAFEFPETYDVITCMFDSLNYITRKNEITRIFRRVHKNLSPEGLFIFDINTFQGIKDGWSQTTVRHGKDYTLLLEGSFNEKKALGQLDITGFIKQGLFYRKFTETHIEKGYDPSDIEELLAKTGFRFKKMDGQTFKTARKKSGRLLYICSANNQNV